MNVQIHDCVLFCFINTDKSKQYKKIYNLSFLTSILDSQSVETLGSSDLSEANKKRTQRHLKCSNFCRNYGLMSFMELLMINQKAVWCYD